MVVGTLRIDLLIRDARSLKDKRRVVLSLKDRIRGRFQVAVAEVDYQDLWQRASLGVAAIGPDRHPIESVLSKIVDFVRFNERGAELLDYKIEFP